MDIFRRFSPAVVIPLLLAAAGSAAAQAPATQYFAVRQAATGDCVVAVGVQAIAQGDTVFGTFSSYQEAIQALQSECFGPQETPPPAAPAPVIPAKPTPVPIQATPAPPVAGAHSVFASPILAVPKVDNDEATEGIFFVNLDTGSAFFIDKVRRSPLSVRSRSLNQNVLSVLRRAPGQAALDGQVLVGEIRKGNDTVHALFLVDTTTGVVGYISDLATRSHQGSLQPVSGAPAAGIAADDGHFTLMMRQASSGKTVGAYLCHGSGRCLYFDGVGDIDPRLVARPTDPVPTRGGGLTGLAIVSDNDRTDGLLLIDHQDGSMHHLGVSKKQPWQLEATLLSVNLLASFPRQVTVETPRRFVAIPITAGSGATEEALILDVGSGAIVILEKLQKPEKTRLVGINANIYDRIPREVARPRVITAVPKLDSSGATEGAWLFDSVTGKILFIDEINKPKKLDLKLVEEKAR